METCCLLLSGNESFQDGEKDLETLTGIKVSHSTLQRLVQRTEYQLPEILQGVSEVCIDGGKVRLRSQEIGMESYWRDYKVVRLQGIYYGAFFQDNLSLTDWVNSQRLLYPLICLGDGHDGVWNLFQEIGNNRQRQEILDWYHLKENLDKVGGSLKRLKAAETFLWLGRITDAIALFVELTKKPAQNFINYLKKHSIRLVNYQYCSSEGLCSKRLSFREIKRNYTIRYEHYIYEKVEELTVEQVSKNEQLSPEKVQNIFSRIAARKKKTGETHLV